MDTSWNKVAGWYDSHLKGKSKKAKLTYHDTVIIPRLTSLILKYVKRGSKVIDFACGQGKVTKAIGFQGYQVKGVDLSPDLIKYARENSKGSGIEFYVDDVSALTEQTVLHLGLADAVTITLAIQNIQNLDGLFSSINKILKPQGRIFIVMNHPYFRIPKQTSWGFDDNKIQYRRVDAYMSEKKLPIEMTPGDFVNKGKSKLTWSFHRPLQTYIKSALKNNFAVLDMEEWVSDKTSEPGSRAKAENIARKEIPLFMILILQKLWE